MMHRPPQRSDSAEIRLNDTSGEAWMRADEAPLQHGAWQNKWVITQGGGQEKKRDTRDAVAIQIPYLRVVGLEEEAEGAHSTPVFT